MYWFTHWRWLVNFPLYGCLYQLVHFRMQAAVTKSHKSIISSHLVVPEWIRLATNHHSSMGPNALSVLFVPRSVCLICGGTETNFILFKTNHKKSPRDSWKNVENCLEARSRSLISVACRCCSAFAASARPDSKALDHLRINYLIIYGWPKPTKPTRSVGRW